MDTSCHENKLLLCGCVETAPCFDHALMGERFCRFLLRVERASGVSDFLPVTAPERLLPRFLAPGAFVCASGQLRSYARPAAKLAPGMPRLAVTAFARALTLCDAPVMQNELTLSGRLCRPPTYRKTPLNREITDMLLVCERAYGKTDAIPVIAWGRNARRTAALKQGTLLRLSGRLQSRDYEKLLPDGAFAVRTAYEVSITDFSLPPPPAEEA